MQEQYGSWRTGWLSRYTHSLRARRSGVQTPGDKVAGTWHFQTPLLVPLNLYLPSVPSWHVIEGDLYLVEIFALCYVALIGGELQTFRDTLSVPSWTLKMVPIGCPETLVTTNIRCVIYNNSEYRIWAPDRGEGLNSRTLLFCNAGLNTERHPHLPYHFHL